MLTNQKLTTLMEKRDSFLEHQRYICDSFFEQFLTVPDSVHKVVY